MNYCQRCLYPANHPLGIIFDDQGVCSGCRIHEEKDQIDWAERRTRLRDLLTAYRDKTASGYDCIIPVSGARDSYFIVNIIKNRFGLKPLLVTYNQQYNTEIGIRNLAYLRTIFDCDMISMTVDPGSVKRVTQASLELMGSMYWHNIAGQTVFAVQAATRFKVPLIVWGAHQGVDQVGMFSHLDQVEMTRKYRKEHDLMGYEAEDLIGTADVKEEDILQYLYPNNKQIEAIGVRGIYLNNYIRWDTKAQHEEMIARYGYEAAPQSRTMDTYNDVDSHHYSGLHDEIKYRKVGYGKIVDHATREIRFGRLSRKQGIDLVERYQSRPAADTGLFLEWLGISEDNLWQAVDAQRDPRIWAEESSGEWRLKDSVTRHADDPGVDAVRLPKTGDCEFILPPSRQPAPEPNSYVLVGRGYVDNADRQDKADNR